MRPVYVETLVDAPLGDVWAATQEPSAHQRWDARFTTIDYLSPAPDGCRRFTYATRLLPGLMVDGVGVYLAERHRGNESATSALRFAGTHPLALIGTGAGYWRYQSTPNGVRFLTGYDYRPAWGHCGRIADLAFRPFIGWATAWSFDRLRLWLERGISPASALHRSLTALAFRAIAVIAAALYLEAAAPDLGGAATIVAVAIALYLPPLPGTPSALRCRRHARRSSTEPAALNRLESIR